MDRMTENVIVLRDPESRELVRAAIRAGKKEVVVSGVLLDVRLGENDYIRFRARRFMGGPVATVGQLGREEDVPEPRWRKEQRG